MLRSKWINLNVELYASMLEFGINFALRSYLQLLNFYFALVTVIPRRDIRPQQTSRRGSRDLSSAIRMLILDLLALD